MQKRVPNGTALVPVAEACQLAEDRVSTATVGPCQGCRLAEPTRLATPEKMERVSVTKDTP
jgi:hypothetical protein